MMVGTALRAVRSQTEIRTSIGTTAGSESPPYLMPGQIHPPPENGFHKKGQHVVLSLP